MKDILNPLGLKVVKNLSETCLSARHDAISALFDSCSPIESAYVQVAENLEHKIETRATAKRLLNKFNKLAFTVLLCFWKTILKRFNKNQSKLQTSDITLNTSCEIYSSLKEYNMSKRGTFEGFAKRSYHMWK